MGTCPPDDFNSDAPLTLFQLKRAEGRVINVSSIMGLMCGLPLVSAYQASKYAVEAFTSSLRVELQPFKVKVGTFVCAHRSNQHYTYKAAGT
jgi:short-subunit dehydrogenase